MAFLDFADIYWNFVMEEMMTSQSGITITRTEPRMGLVFAIVVGLLLLVGGGGIILKILDLMFTPTRSQFPVLAWFAAIFIILLLLKRR